MAQLTPRNDEQDDDDLEEDGQLVVEGPDGQPLKLQLPKIRPPREPG
jgi:hypothetical protein